MITVINIVENDKLYLLELCVLSSWHLQCTIKSPIWKLYIHTSVWKELYHFLVSFQRKDTQSCSVYAAKCGSFTFSFLVSRILNNNVCEKSTLLSLNLWSRSRETSSSLVEKAQILKSIYIYLQTALRISKQLDQWKCRLGYLVLYEREKIPSDNVFMIALLLHEG